VKQLDQEVMKRIQEALVETMDRVGEELGLSLVERKISYSEINARIELEVATWRDDGVLMNKYAEDFLRRGQEFAFQPSDLGRRFSCGVHDFRIIGLRPRAKSPVVCQRRIPRGQEGEYVAAEASWVRKHLEGDPCRAAEARVQRPEWRVIDGAGDQQGQALLGFGDQQG